MTRWTQADLEARGIAIPPGSGDRGFREKKPNARGNKVTIDNIVFDSGGEGARYETLKLMQASGEIRRLAVHVSAPLIVYAHGVTNIGYKVCDFFPDFEYERAIHGAETTAWFKVTEDFKGRRSGSDWKIFRLKAKLFEALYGRPVEVYPIIPKKPRRSSARTTKA